MLSCSTFETSENKPTFPSTFFSSHMCTKFTSSSLSYPQCCLCEKAEKASGSQMYPKCLCRCQSNVQTFTIFYQKYIHMRENAKEKASYYIQHRSHYYTL